jgi:hypothetical protein
VCWRRTKCWRVSTGSSDTRGVGATGCPHPFFLGFFLDLNLSLYGAGHAACVRRRIDGSADSGLSGRSWCTRGRLAGGYLAAGRPIAGLVYGLRGPQISGAIEGCGLRRFECVRGPRTKRFSAMGRWTRVACPRPFPTGWPRPRDRPGVGCVVCVWTSIFLIHTPPRPRRSAGGGSVGRCGGCHVRGSKRKRRAGEMFSCVGHPPTPRGCEQPGG